MNPEPGHVQSQTLGFISAFFPPPLFSCCLLPILSQAMVRNLFKHKHELMHGRLRQSKTKDSDDFLFLMENSGIDCARQIYAHQDPYSQTLIITLAFEENLNMGLLTHV